MTPTILAYAWKDMPRNVKDYKAIICLEMAVDCHIDHRLGQTKDYNVDN